MSEPTAHPQAPDPGNDEYDERQETARLRAKRRRARRVLLAALLAVLVALGIAPIWPWLLPAFIWEGPLVQMASGQGMTLVWYMTRPVSHGLTVTVGEEGRLFPVETEGSRCRAVVTGLEPGRSYPYAIRLGRRSLAEDELRTNKPPGEPFTFIVLGDSGRGSQEQYRLAHGMIALDPDFVLHTGDVVYSAGQRENYRERFFEPYAPLLARVNFWPCLGNHDVYEPDLGRPYHEVFELPENGPPEQPPERNYWFDYADARIAVIDSNVDAAALAEQTAPWLENVLSQTSARWKFVVFHHPPYTAGHYPPDQRIQNTLVPVFESTSVDVVFNGHDHMYQRTLPLRGGVPAGTDASPGAGLEGEPPGAPPPAPGVVYIVTGAGGARLYQALPPEQRPPYCAALNDAVHSFTYVSVAGAELALRQIDIEGRIIDEWTLRKAEPQ